MLGPVLVVLAQIPAAPVVAAMACGFIMALVGHIVRSNQVVGTGIAVLFLATAAMVVLAYVDYNSESGSNDPRPKNDSLPNQVYPDRER